MDYKPPELPAGLPINKKSEHSYSETTNVPTKKIIEQFLELSKELDIEEPEKEKIIADPVEYFSDAFEGRISDNHIIIFLKLAIGRYDFPKEEIFHLALFLRDYVKNHIKEEKPFNQKELQLTSIAIKFIERHLYYFEKTQKGEVDDDKQQIEMLAYLTNWLTKIKIHTKEMGHPGNLDLSSNFFDFIKNNVLEYGEREFSTKTIDDSFTCDIQESSTREISIESYEKQIQELKKGVKRTKKIDKLIMSLRNPEISFLNVLTEDATNWSDFIEYFNNNIDQIELNNDSISQEMSKFIETIQSMIDQHQIDQGIIIKIINALTKEGTNEKARLTLTKQLEDAQTNLIKKRKEVENTFLPHTLDNFNESIIEVRRRIENLQVYPAADLYLVKGILCVLYLLYKSAELNIPDKELLESLNLGENGKLKIKSKGFETDEASVIYFDGGTALHYYKRQMPFIFAVAKQMFKNKIKV